MQDYLHPILSCEQAQSFEQALLGTDAENWRAIGAAGAALAAALVEDWGARPWNFQNSASARQRVLVLVGKGNNGADALVAAATIIKQHPRLEIVLYRSAPVGELRPLCRRAWDALLALPAAEASLAITDVTAQGIEAGIVRRGPFLVCIDGLLGMKFSPPLRPAEAAILAAVNERTQVGLRAAVDMPSGLGDPGAFNADFTYATGIVKQPVVQEEHRAKVGRLRYLDLGFFRGQPPQRGAEDIHILTSRVLAGLQGWRNPAADKRHYGHLFVIGGSASMPGALLMNVQSALRSGVGLVTAFAPQSVAAAFAAQAPEAMWVPWPQTDEGTLALEGQHLLMKLLPRASAVLMGSGVGENAETLALVEDIVRVCGKPLVLDADALRPGVLAAAARRGADAGATVLTPHAGEFARLSGLRSPSVSGEYLRAFCREHDVVTVLKGPITQVADAHSIAYSCFGGPVLARAGSGDVLAGLLGGQLAQNPEEPLLATHRAVSWHGIASILLARSRGELCVRTGDLIEMLPSVVGRNSFSE